MKVDRQSGTATYAQAGGTWSHMTAVRRLSGVDLIGIQVQGVSSGWNGSTVQAILQGCNVDASAAGTEPDNNSGWQDVETLSFTTDAYKWFGGSDFYSSVGPFQWWRIKGNVSAGAPSANVVFSIVSQGDYED